MTRHQINMRVAWAVTIAATIIVLLALTGCANARYGVLSSINSYEYEVARYEEACGTKAVLPVVVTCVAQHDTLIVWKGFIGEAEAATARGGSLPKQKAALKAAEKAAEKAKSWQKKS